LSIELCKYIESLTEEEESVKYITKNKIMKKIFSPFLFLLVSVSLSAQSLEILDMEGNTIDEDYVIEELSSEELIENHFMIANVSSSSIHVKVKKYLLKELEGTEAYFCWLNCYEPSVSISPNSLKIAASDTNKTDFYADFKPHGTAGESKVAYTFYDENNKADSVQLVLHYKLNTATRINDLSHSFTMGPNPANRQVKFMVPENIHQEAYIEVYNSLGRMVKKARFINNQAILPVHNLSTGIYFCKLITAGGDQGVTKRLLISR